MQQLEGKITGELNTLKERIGNMESELHTYRDLDTLRRTAEEKKKVTLLQRCGTLSENTKCTFKKFVLRDSS